MMRKYLLVFPWKIKLKKHKDAQGLILSKKKSENCPFFSPLPSPCLAHFVLKQAPLFPYPVTAWKRRWKKERKKIWGFFCFFHRKTKKLKDKNMWKLVGVGLEGKNYSYRK